MSDARVLIITDRTELDEQIERGQSGAHLLASMNQPNPWLLCSLVHKFGRHGEDSDEMAAEEYIAEMKRNLPQNFSVKGNLFVFVDECHRTQSGMLHDAMNAILVCKVGPSADVYRFYGYATAEKRKT